MKTVIAKKDFLYTIFIAKNVIEAIKKSELSQEEKEKCIAKARTLVDRDIFLN